MGRGRPPLLTRYAPQPKRTCLRPQTGARRGLHTLHRPRTSATAPTAARGFATRRFVPSEPTWSVQELVTKAMDERATTPQLLDDATLQRLFALAELEPPADAAAWDELHAALLPLVRLIECVRHAQVPRDEESAAERGAAAVDAHHTPIKPSSVNDGTAPLPRDELLAAAPRRTAAGYFVCP